MTPKLAQAIAEVARRADLYGHEFVIEHRLDERGEVCTVSQRRCLAHPVVEVFERPFGASDWTQLRS
jgi:hypothetical protein